MISNAMEQANEISSPHSWMVVHRSIPEMLFVQGKERGQVIALEDVGRDGLSYGELSQLVVSLVGDLTQAGVKRADRVAVVIPNGRDMSTTLLGVCSAAIAAPLNPAYREDEFADYFREIRVSYLVIRRGVDSPARAAAAKMGIKVIELTEDARALLPEGLEVRPETPTKQGDLPDPDDIALILLTSGSTGRSKKVPLTHRNICVSVRDTCRTLELTPDDRCLCMWEQFHIGGLVDLLMVPLASGGSVICTGGFDAARFFELLRTKSPTWYQGVPATVHELMAHARKHGIESAPNSLRFIRVTASALAPKLMGELEEYFGVPVITTFGMTEAAPLITTNLLPPHARKAGSTGPSCGPEVAVMDAEGNLLKTGEVGEVVVRGENVMSGYEDAPEANAHSFRHGWFHTGDTGCLDEDGYLFLKGRIKESINRGGEKITPQEIDDVLLTHPQIAEAISFHVPHSVLGEDVAVAVVLHKPGSLSENDIRDYVASRLAEFKVPRKVLFVEGFTRGPSGKVNRSALADVLGVTAKKTYEPPVTDLEKTLADIWARELNVPKVGRNDSFADLGGDSLSTARMILAVENKISKVLSLQDKSIISIGTSPLHLVAGNLEQQLIEVVNSTIDPLGENKEDKVSVSKCGIGLFRLRVVFTRFFERILPIPVLRLVFLPSVLLSALFKWIVYKKHDWKSIKLPKAMRCKGNNFIFLWKKLIKFFLLQILTYFPDRLTEPRWARRIRFEGLEKVNELVANKEPFILATLHFGHQRLLRYLLSNHGINCCMLTLDGNNLNQRSLVRDFYFNQKRPSNPITPIKGISDFSIAEVMSQLIKGGGLLMAVDVGIGKQIDSQIPDGEGSFRMAAGAIRMARYTGAKLLPCLLYEEKPWRLVIRIEEAINLGAMDCDLDNLTAANELTSAFWRTVSVYSEQYDCGPISFWKCTQSDAP